MRLFTAFLSTFLIPLVAVMPLRAELADAVSAAPTVPAETIPGQTNLLKIRLADDSKATVEANSIVKGYAIMVTDSAGAPVPDAAVAIRLPEEGATGFFLNGERSAVAYTNASGVAVFPQVNWGSATGSLSVRVTAVKGDLHAGALIEQNVIAAGTKRPASASVTPFPSTEPNTKPNTQPTPQPSNQPRNEQPTPATVQASAAKVKTPGVPASVAAIHTGAAPDQTAPETAASNDSVSVVNTSGSKGGGSNTKKWVIVAAIVAGAGIGAALALGGKGGAVTTSSASSGTSIGSPTVSIGH